MFQLTTQLLTSIKEKMKLLFKNPYSLIAFVSLVLIGSTVYYEYRGVYVGETWEHSIKEPFFEHKCQRKALRITGRYVQYSETTSYGEQRIKLDTISYFKYHSHKIK